MINLARNSNFNYFAELPIFLDRLFYKPALIPRIDSFFLGMLNIKLLKYFKFAAPQVRSVNRFFIH